MKKIIMCITLLILIILLKINVNISVSSVTTGKTGIFSLSIPNNYKKSNSDYNTYYEMEKYNSNKTDTFFRIIVCNKTFFKLPSKNVPFSKFLNIPINDLSGFSLEDLDKDVKKIESAGYKITNKTLLTINGYPARRVTAVNTLGYTTDIYQIISNNYFAELYFYSKTESTSKSFTNSSTQKIIVNSFKFNNDTSSNCKNFEFEDVNTSDWHYSAVRYAYNNSIIKGYSTKEFAPDDNLTRGMMVTILYRMAGSPKVNGTSKFMDVTNSKEWYYNSVLWALNNKIASGYNDGNFGPNDNITREQLAVFLYNYAKYEEKELETAKQLESFKDENEISNFAIDQMKWATAVGVITGNNNTTPPTLNPLGTATRAEAASMLYKYCTKVRK